MTQITNPIIVEIAPKTYFINEFGMTSHFVLVGEERALVIDGGCGFYDMRVLVEKLTDKPYDLVLTHGHGDHAAAIDQFEQVYVHRDDAFMLAPKNEETIARQHGYCAMMLNMTGGHYEESDRFSARYTGIWGVKPEDFIVKNKFPEIRFIEDQFVFHLGNRDVTVYHVPGHSPGSCAFLDSKSRILFAGDAINSNVNVRTCALSTALKALLRIRGLYGVEYDQTFTSHTSYAASINVFSQPIFVLDDVIEAMRSVLRGDAEIKEVTSHLDPNRKEKVAVHGVAGIGWDESKLWEENEPHIVP